MVRGEPDEVLVARRVEDALLEHLGDALRVVERVARDRDAPVPVERVEADRRDRVQRVAEPQLAAAYVHRRADPHGMERERAPEQVLAEPRERRVLPQERAEDVRRRVEADLRLLEELLERARVVVGVAVREDDAVDRLRRDAARAQVVGRVGRRVDEDRATAHPEEEARRLAAGVEAVARAEDGDAERRRHPRRGARVRIGRRGAAREADGRARPRRCPCPDPARRARRPDR